jgi:superfamily I DNA/RNA helicase
MPSLPTIDRPLTLEWDRDQQIVIEAEPQARQLVIAGPGTGKTAVACGRIAYLINKCGIEPVNVLLVSFTRTAVAELRDRIATFIGHPAQAAGVRIATIDSTTWTLLNGFDSNSASAFGGYDANIARLCEQFRARNEDLLEHMRKYEHVVVDEAQDILGLRAALIDAVIDSTSPACGITVLADPCQAIYGFTNENGEAGAADNSCLVDRLKSRQSGAFVCIPLETLHRTSEPKLIELLSITRPVVTSATGFGKGKYRLLRALIEKTATALPTNRTSLAEAVSGRNDLLILYRTRAEALVTASMLSSSAVPHRLRISGLPAWLQPWIGAVFGDYTWPEIERPAFDRL